MASNRVTQLQDLNEVRFKVERRGAEARFPGALVTNVGALLGNEDELVPHTWAEFVTHIITTE